MTPIIVTPAGTACPVTPAPDTPHADAALAEMGAVRVKPLRWEDHPADDGPVMSKAEALHGTYFIVDDTDDFSGLYVQLISHDKAQWWQHVRSTCETLVENVHSDDLGPLKAAAQADYEARILATIEPAPVSAREAARVLLDQPYEAMKKAFYAMDSKQGEGADRIMAAALRAIAGGKE